MKISLQCCVQCFREQLVLGKDGIDNIDVNMF